jgi:hypothetical protein
MNASIHGGAPPGVKRGPAGGLAENNLANRERRQTSRFDRDPQPYSRHRRDMLEDGVAP